MKLGARLFEVLALWSTYDYCEPADTYLHHALKMNRYIGSSDRRAIRDLFYDLLRKHILLEGKIHGFIKKTGNRPVNTLEFYRWMLLAHLKETDQKGALATFTGEKYHLDTMTEVEEKLLAIESLQPLDAASSHNLTPFWYEKLHAQFGEMLLELMASLDQEAPLDVRVNTLKFTIEEAMDLLANHNVKAHVLPYSPVGLRIHDKRSFPNDLVQQGLFEPQDEGSQIITLMCDVKPGMRIVDFCAGAGGKTLGLAMDMKNKGQIIASDISQKRLNRAKERFRRLNLQNIVVKMMDAQWIKRHTGEFDRVLVDAPCSGSGTWRRNPELKQRTNEKDLHELVQKQRAIVNDASRLVKKGGRLIYATCSLLKDENDDQIAWFLDQHPDFQLIDLSNEMFFNTPPCNTPTWSMTPLKNNTDGFFLSCMEKK